MTYLPLAVNEMNILSFVRKVWRYQRRNQKTKIKAQTIQLPKEKKENISTQKG